MQFLEKHGSVILCVISLIILIMSILIYSRMKNCSPKEAYKARAMLTSSPCDSQYIIVNFSDVSGTVFVSKPFTLNSGITNISILDPTSNVWYKATIDLGNMVIYANPDNKTPLTQHNVSGRKTVYTCDTNDTDLGNIAIINIGDLKQDMNYDLLSC